MSLEVQKAQETYIEQLARYIGTKKNRKAITESFRSPEITVRDSNIMDEDEFLRSIASKLSKAKNPELAVQKFIEALKSELIIKENVA